MEKDPVCGMQVDPKQAAANRNYQGRNYYFCSASCAARFDQDPQRYITSESRGKGSTPAAKG